MKQIGEIGKALSVNKKFTNTHKAWGWLAAKKNEIIFRYGDAESFASAYNPSVQIKCAMNIERSLTGDVPTIRQLLHTYQLEHLQVWVMAQLHDLNEYVGVKNKMAIEQMKELARTIIVKSEYLKASELLLFFHQLKAGDFGVFYGTVDPQKVGDYLNTFKEWRSQELDKILNKQAQELRENKRIEWKKTGITREEYDLACEGVVTRMSYTPALQISPVTPTRSEESVPKPCEK